MTPTNQQHPFRSHESWTDTVKTWIYAAKYSVQQHEMHPIRLCILGLSVQDLVTHIRNICTYVGPPLLQEYIGPPLLQEDIGPPLLQEDIGPPLLQEYIGPPLLQEYLPCFLLGCNNCIEITTTKRTQHQTPDCMSSSVLSALLHPQLWYWGCQCGRGRPLSLRALQLCIHALSTAILGRTVRVPCFHSGVGRMETHCHSKQWYVHHLDSVDAYISGGITLTAVNTHSQGG